MVLAVAVPLRARAHDARPWLIAERTLVFVALAWALGVTVYLVRAPAYEGVEAFRDAGMAVEQAKVVRRTLLEVDGPGVLVPLLIPVILSALPLVRLASASRRCLAVISAVLLLGFVVVGVLSVGLFYAPSAMAMLVAAALSIVGRRPA